MDCCLTKHKSELAIELCNEMRGRRFVVIRDYFDDLYSNRFAYRPG